MKSFICTLSIAAIVTLAACKKEALIQTTTTQKKTTGATPTGATQLSSDQLVGTWKVIGSMISAGGPMYFVPATGNDLVSFNADGRLSGSAFSDFIMYTLKSDKITVTMTKTDTSVYQNYICQINNDTLTMSPGEPAVCIEGCAIKLVKQ